MTASLSLLLVIQLSLPGRSIRRCSGSLYRQGILSDPFFPDLVVQALGDIGVLRERGLEALERIFTGEIPPSGELFRAGQAIFLESGTVTDVRTLFGVSLKVGVAGSATDFAGVERSSGHVLAGVITASSDQSEIRQVLDFVRSVAGRPSGRAEPGPGLARDLEKGMQENEQLLRAVTGDYTWRAVPMHPESCMFRPLVDLWPERHLLLYDPAELAYRSPDATRALVMEAWYGMRFRLDASGLDTPDNPWYPRLSRVLGIPGALRKGFALHPGVSRWIDRFCREEYSLANLCADRSRISRLPLPDQFLEGVLYEARTGDPAVHIRDEAIQYVLRVTFEARMEMETATDEKCVRIIRERVWPVFEQVCLVQDGYGAVGSVSPAGTGAGKALPFTPRGTIAREDDSVQSPQSALIGFHRAGAHRGERQPVRGWRASPPCRVSRRTSAIRQPEQRPSRGPGQRERSCPGRRLSGGRRTARQGYQPLWMP